MNGRLEDPFSDNDRNNRNRISNGCEDSCNHVRLYQDVSRRNNLTGNERERMSGSIFSDNLPSTWWNADDDEETTSKLDSKRTVTNMSITHRRQHMINEHFHKTLASFILGNNISQLLFSCSWRSIYEGNRWWTSSFICSCHCSLRKKQKRTDFTPSTCPTRMVKILSLYVYVLHWLVFPSRRIYSRMRANNRSFFLPLSFFLQKEKRLIFLSFGRSRKSTGNVLRYRVHHSLSLSLWERNVTS